jgi:hypothetical protein
VSDARRYEIHTSGDHVSLVNWAIVRTGGPSVHKEPSFTWKNKKSNSSYMMIIRVRENLQ